MKQSTSSCTVKKFIDFPVSPWPGIIKLLQARESLVSDIPAEDGKIANLFLQCVIFLYIFWEGWIRSQSAAVAGGRATNT